MARGIISHRVGDAIYLAPRPSGFFMLSEIPDAANLWMISTGTGIGPFLSMLKNHYRTGIENATASRTSIKPKWKLGQCSNNYRRKQTTHEKDFR